MSAPGVSGRGTNVKCLVDLIFCCYIMQQKAKTSKMNCLNTVNLLDKYGFKAEFKTLVEVASYE